MGDCLKVQDKGGWDVNTLIVVLEEQQWLNKY